MLFFDTLISYSIRPQTSCYWEWWLYISGVSLFYLFRRLQILTVVSDKKLAVILRVLFVLETISLLGITSYLAAATNRELIFFLAQLVSHSHQPHLALCLLRSYYVPMITVFLRYWAHCSCSSYFTISHHWLHGWHVLIEVFHWSTVPSWCFWHFTKHQKSGTRSTEFKVLTLWKC